MILVDPFVFKNSHFGIWENFEFGYFQCTGDETHLVNCSTNTSPSYCEQKDQAGLRCATQVINECTHGDIQLTGSDNPLIEGKLEMCYNGIWTPVCANYMQDEETIVTCKQLGHTQYSCKYKLLITIAIIILLMSNFQGDLFSLKVMVIRHW